MQTTKYSNDNSDKYKNKNRWQLLEQFDFLQLIQFQNDLFSHLIDFNWKFVITFETFFFFWFFEW